MSVIIIDFSAHIHADIFPLSMIIKFIKNTFLINS